MTRKPRATVWLYHPGRRYAEWVESFGLTSHDDLRGILRGRIIQWFREMEKSDATRIDVWEPLELGPRARPVLGLRIRRKSGQPQGAWRSAVLGAYVDLMSDYLRGLGAAGATYRQLEEDLCGTKTRRKPRVGQLLPYPTSKTTLAAIAARAIHEGRAGRVGDRGPLIHSDHLREAWRT